MKVLISLIACATAQYSLNFEHSNPKSSLKSDDKIQCALCDYSWVVAGGVTTPVRGDSKCRDNPDESHFMEFQKEGSYNLSDGSSIKWRTKCSIVQSKGIETIYYTDEQGQDQTWDIEYDVFDRKIYQVYENTSFYDYEGDIELTENAWICGGNRSECGGNIELRENVGFYECPADNNCACPRCNWFQVNNNGTMKNIQGDRTCALGTYDGPEADNSTCSFNPKPIPGPMMKPSKNAELAPLIAELMPEATKKSINKGSKAASMSGNCVIYQEFFSMPDESQKGNFENINLYRVCNSSEIMPYNFYSTMVTNSTQMTICFDDLCNFSPNPKPSGAIPTSIAIALLLISLIF